MRVSLVLRLMVARRLFIGPLNQTSRGKQNPKTRPPCIPPGILPHLCHEENETARGKRDCANPGPMIYQTHFLTLSLLLLLAGNARPAEPLASPFHFGSGKDKPKWSLKTQKRLDACAADYQAVLHGKKPIHAESDPAQESTASNQFYQGDRYQIHVTRTSVFIDGARGVVYGPIFELEEGFAEGEMLSLMHTAFYTAEELAKAEPSEAPFHVGAGKDKPAWDEKAQKRIADCTADYQAVIEGKKPAHAKADGKTDMSLFKGGGYQLEIIKEEIVLGGVQGFLYGPMLDLDPDPSHTAETDSISHIVFYTADEMKSLLSKSAP